MARNLQGLGLFTQQAILRIDHGIVNTLLTSAIDRNDSIVLEYVCMGRISSADLKRAYNGKINSQSIICSDSHKSYIQFTKNFTLEHVRIKTGRHKNGIFHINHVNSLHSNLKEWVKRFKGVSTKFLANYLYWFKWFEKTKQDLSNIYR